MMDRKSLRWIIVLVIIIVVVLVLNKLGIYNWIEFNTENEIVILNNKIKFEV